MAKLQTSVYFIAYIPYMLSYTYVILWHIMSLLLILIFISVAFLQTIRDWNALPDYLISSAGGAGDRFAKFTSLARAGDYSRRNHYVNRSC